MNLACSSPPPVPPVNPWVCHTVRIREITPEVADVATYHLSFDDPAVAAAYRFQPGQFNMLYLPGVGEVPISLSADPSSTTTWAHTVRAVGNVTHQLARLTVGDTLGLRGPFGSSWPLHTAEGHDVVDDVGLITFAKIVPPTSQNQRQIEDDLRDYLPSILNDDEAATSRQCERLVRCYDPCISCSTHFLKLTVQRDESDTK